MNSHPLLHPHTTHQLMYHCDVCSSDCTNRIRINCAECPEYDLCVPCFANGSATGPHKPYHAYRIIEQNAYPVFTPDWGADEELALIEGSQKHGLGNWQDVSDHIGGRTKEETAQHYNDVYLFSPTYPIPDLNVTVPKVAPAVFAKERKDRIESHRKQPLSIHKKPLVSTPLCHEVQGYMPGRLEFETEAENEAEVPVKDMIFDPDDQPQDIDLKLAVLGIYNSRLTTRAERKRLIIQHGLLEYRKNAALDKKRCKEEKDMYTKIKPFSRLMTPQDFEDFSVDMMEEVRCRMRLQQLQEWRHNGITSLDLGAKYEKDKAARLAARSGNFSRLNQTPTGTLSSHRLTNTSANSSRRSMSYANSPAPEFQNKKIKLGGPFDISHAPDYDLLSEEERNLCSSLRILPKTYLVIKETLFRELLRTGGVLKRKTARDLLKVDVSKTSRIYDFFLQQKWCNAA